MDVAAEMEDVAWALEMLDEATTLDVRHVRAVLGRPAHVRARSVARGRMGSPTRRGFCWLVGQGGAGIKTSPALASAVAAIVGDAVRGPRSWPRVGVLADDLAPGRFR